MKNLVKNVFLSLTFMSLIPMTALAANKGSKSSEKFDWSTVMEAIIQVESEGNPRAVSGNSVGVMQITPILVEDCNQILKDRKSKKRFRLADRYNAAKSKEMFLLIQSHYNPENNVEKAIRSWNGGQHFSRRATNRYFKKVMALLK